MNVKQIVKEYLKAQGFDGLCNIDCGCGFDDLMPCCETSEDCEVAMASPDPDDPGYMIYTPACATDVTP